MYKKRHYYNFLTIYTNYYGSSMCTCCYLNETMLRALAKTYSRLRITPNITRMLQMYAMILLDTYYLWIIAYRMYSKTIEHKMDY